MSHLTKTDALAALKDLRGFIGPDQLHILGEVMRGEEKQFFFDLLGSLAERVKTMPKTYEQDGKGGQARAFLHYFKGSGDWYITGKDCDLDGEGQVQAFGQADLGFGPELGYISITELIENNVELDFYYTPKTLNELNQEKE